MAKDEIMDDVKKEVQKQVHKAIMDELNNIDKGGGKGAKKAKKAKKGGKKKKGKKDDDDDDDESGDKPEDWEKIDKVMHNGKFFPKEKEARQRRFFRACDARNHPQDREGDHR